MSAKCFASCNTMSLWSSNWYNPRTAYQKRFLPFDALWLSFTGAIGVYRHKNYDDDNRWWLATEIPASIRRYNFAILIDTHGKADYIMHDEIVMKLGRSASVLTTSLWFVAVWDRSVYPALFLSLLMFCFCLSLSVCLCMSVYVCLSLAVCLFSLCQSVCLCLYLCLHRSSFSPLRVITCPCCHTISLFMA